MTLGSIGPRSERLEVELGSVVSHVKLSALPGELPAETRFVGLENIRSRAGELIGASSVSEVRSRVFQFRANDVLYGRLRPYLQKAALVEFDGTCSGEVVVMRCSAKILPRYLLTVLLSEDFTQFVSARTKGDRPRTSFATVASYRFELPSLEAQADICALDNVLATTLARLGEAVERVEANAEHILDQTRSRLIWEGAEKANLVPLISLVNTIDYGTTKKSIHGGAGIPILRIPNIASSGEIESRDLKYSALVPKELERYRLRSGDLLLIRSNGSLSLVGRAAQVRDEHEGMAFAGYLLRMRPAVGVSSEYLLQLIKSTSFRQLVEGAARSSTGINNLSAGRLAEFMVPQLSEERQHEVVGVLERLEAAANVLCDEMRRSEFTATEVQRTARSVWLGQSQLGEVQSVPVSSTHADPPQGQVRAAPEKENTRARILERISRTPNQVPSSNGLFDGMPDDYDAIRDALFQLLTSKPVKVRQEFDRETRSMILRRTH